MRMLLVCKSEATQDDPTIQKVYLWDEGLGTAPEAAQL